jgi:hypothetical protein
MSLAEWVVAARQRLGQRVGHGGPGSLHGYFGGAVAGGHEVQREGATPARFLPGVPCSNECRLKVNRVVLTVLRILLAYPQLWREEESARPPEELLAAIGPGLSSLESVGSRMIGISTPFKKSGLLFEKFQKHFGQRDEFDDVLVVNARTRLMNTVISQDYIDKEIRKDPEHRRVHGGIPRGYRRMAGTGDPTGCR